MSHSHRSTSVGPDWVAFIATLLNCERADPAFYFIFKKS